ncbi:MAG TPA: class I SAM-dependent methyltransferase [bacterium]|nr:class I SAM-dependent methyltransferase [bacterium]
MNDLYGKLYFEEGIQTGKSLYENYRWLPHLTIPMVKSIVKHTKMSPKSSILDVGCAKGYMVRAFRELGFNAWGIDASLYAINHLDETVQKGYTRIFLVYRMQIWPFRDNEFDWVITKDTLEHLTERELDFVLHESSRVAPKAFHIIPMGDGESYFCKDYEKDITHKLRRPMGWWADIFQKNGFRVLKKSYRVKGIKDKWYKSHHKGNGFFMLERRNG